MVTNLLDRSREELTATIAALGAPRYVGMQVYEWLYRKGVDDIDRMSNLSKALRARISRECAILRPEVACEQTAADGTRKYLFRLADGSVETVLIAMGNNRWTLCISTQIGCAMGCKFCRTATMGLVRHLTQGEILSQVLAVRRLRKDLPATSDQRPATPFTNIVLMGMGEPLHNYDAVVGALRILIDPKGCGFSKRHVTLSTVGLVPAIHKLAGEGLGMKLALSLHATTDAVRQQLIPMARKYPLAEVLDACRAYARATGARHRVTFEYLLIKGVNDHDDDIKRLVRIASHLPSKVNVIPLNPWIGCPWERPADADVERFVAGLRAKHVQVNVRISRGREILAACGQLATQKASVAFS